MCHYTTCYPLPLATFLCAHLGTWLDLLGHHEWVFGGSHLIWRLFGLTFTPWLNSPFFLLPGPLATLVRLLLIHFVFARRLRPNVKALLKKLHCLVSQLSQVWISIAHYCLERQPNWASLVTLTAHFKQDSQLVRVSLAFPTVNNTVDLVNRLMNCECEAFVHQNIRSAQQFNCWQLRLHLLLGRAIFPLLKVPAINRLPQCLQLEWWCVCASLIFVRFHLLI